MIMIRASVRTMVAALVLNFYKISKSILYAYILFMVTMVNKSLDKLLYFF